VVVVVVIYVVVIIVTSIVIAAAAVAPSQFLQFLICKKYLYEICMHSYYHIYANVRCPYTNTYTEMFDFVHDYKVTPHFPNGELEKTSCLIFR